MCDLIQNLHWRGMIQNMTPGIAAQLKKEKTTAYIGFEPTAPSLHIGNLAALMLLKQFQIAGHRPTVLIGGATALIGDPAGKSAERALASEESIRYNQECISKQLSKFLDFSASANGALLFNNIEWFKDFSFLKFLRDVGKHIPIGYMIAKDLVKRRLETGISFTEFTYQLLQGYDFYYLYTHHGIKLQMGGADQWGNLTTGIELVRKKAGAEVFALTTPLLTKSDGSKFGKTEKGNIWLDANLTSPYTFYQFWLNCTDTEAQRLIKIFTFLKQEEIDDLLQKHEQTPHERILQKVLAKELTLLVHSKTDYDQASKASHLLFGQSTAADLLTLSEHNFLAIFASAPKICLNATELATVKDITDFLTIGTQGTIFQSKREARRMIESGGISINKEKILDPTHPFSFLLIKERYILVQKGKKNYYLIVVS